MTRVKLVYNPFTIKTEFLVNDESLKSTSTLYRYRNTPMQDWVGSFLNDLVEHCNDDEIELTFHGLQFNFNDLQEQVDSYSEKNMDVEIILKDEISISQVGRIGKLLTVIDEIKDKDFIDSIDESVTTILRVVCVSGNSNLKAQVINKIVEAIIIKEDDSKGTIISDNDQQTEKLVLDVGEDFKLIEYNIPFSNSKYASLHIVNTPNSETKEKSYYRYIKKAINDNEKPIILYVLDEISTSNNEEFLTLISDEYKNKGKQNKDRFIFVAQNRLSAKKYLYSEYAMKNANVYSIDDIYEIQDVISKYMEQYSLISRITNTYEFISNQLVDMKNRLNELADRSEQISVIEEEYKKSVEFLKEMKSTIDSTLILDNGIDELYSDLIKKVGCDFLDNFYLNGNQNSKEKIYKEKALDVAAYFIKEKMMQVILNYYKETAELDEMNSKTVEYNQNGLLEQYVPRLFKLVKEVNSHSFDLDKVLKTLKMNLKKVDISSTDMSVPSQNYYPKTHFVEKYTNRSSYSTYTGTTRETSYIDHRFSDFYDGILALTTAEINTIGNAGIFGTLFTKVDNVIEVENEKLVKVRESFEFWLTGGEEVFKATFSEIIDIKKKYIDEIKVLFIKNIEEIELKLRADVDELKGKAQISENDSEKIDYIQDLELRVKTVIEI